MHNGNDMTGAVGGRARNRGQRLRWQLTDLAEAVRATLWPFRRQGATAAAFIIPACLVVFVLVAGLALIVEMSFHVFDYQTFRLGTAYTLSNYTEAIVQPAYLRLLGRSLLAACIVTAICLVFGFPYAYVMVRTRSSLARKLLLIGLFLPFFLGEVVRAFGWLIILGDNGLLTSVLGWFGFGPAQLAYSYTAVIIGLTQYLLPLGILMLAPALTAIPEEVEMASEGLGASWLATLWHVVLPMAKPGLVAGATVIFTIALTNYTMPVILGGGTQDFIANAIYDAFLQLNAPGLGAALSVVVVVLGSVFIGLLYALVSASSLSLARERN